jgi:hypothetical protein
VFFLWSFPGRLRKPFDRIPFLEPAVPKLPPLDPLEIFPFSLALIGIVVLERVAELGFGVFEFWR